jgi:tripartite-type tricarboxylate transporter receptor subunit TctC
VSSKARAPLSPDVPTTLESGFPDSDYTLWVGILGPVGTPKEVTSKLNAEMKKALESPALREKLDKIGVQTMPMSPDAFGGLINTEIKTYGDFVKKAGIKVN